MKPKRSKYDPDRSPDSAWWSSLDEEEQINLVLDHHLRAGARLPNSKLHAVTHVVVETQVRLGDETPVASTLVRLIGDGLSRHDAIHAIGTVLAPIIFEILKGEVRSDPNVVYYQRLRRATDAGAARKP